MLGVYHWASYSIWGATGCVVGLGPTSGNVRKYPTFTSYRWPLEFPPNSGGTATLSQEMLTDDDATGY